MSSNRQTVVLILDRFVMTGIRPRPPGRRADTLTVRLQYLLVPACDVVEHRVAGLTRPCLVEDVEILQRFELIFLMHVVFGHDFLKFSTRHIHRAPAIWEKKTARLNSIVFCS